MTREAFTALYERQVDLVYRLCFTFLKNKADTEDAVQNTFIKLLRADLSFESAGHERAWLIVTASNTCRDALRRASTRDVPLESFENTLAAPDALENDVLRAVLELPEKYRELVYLTYYEGYTSAELSEMLNRPASTIRNQLREARALMKLELGGNDDAD